MTTVDEAREALDETRWLHCHWDCPKPGEPDDDDRYPCGQRHWCPWCGDCEGCEGQGPHEWD